MSLITPLDPGSSRGERAARPPVDVQQSVHTTLFWRIASAVASSCGSDHGVNEDAHSALDRSTALFVVADGVGGGAMAAMASRGLVAHLHAALGIHGVAATRLELGPGGRYTGRLQGANCRAEQKVVRLDAWLAERGLHRRQVTLWAYGDSAGDRQLLAVADHPVWVKEPLASVAQT